MGSVIQRSRPRGAPKAKVEQESIEQEAWGRNEGEEFTVQAQRLRESKEGKDQQSSGRGAKALDAGQRERETACLGPQPLVLP